MPKLKTPVQYEPSLEGLNTVRPLSYEGRSKMSLSYPVLCRNKPGTLHPAKGKLLRCTPSGAALINKPELPTAYELITENFEQADPNKLIQFSQPVSFVMSLLITVGMVSAIYTTDPTYTMSLLNLYTNVGTFIPFVGTNLYIKTVHLLPDITVTWGFYGYY